MPAGNTIAGRDGPVMRLIDGDAEQLQRELVLHLRHFRSRRANALVNRLKRRGHLHAVPADVPGDQTDRHARTGTTLGWACC